MKKRPLARRKEKRGVLWQAPRLEGKVKNVAIRPTRKKRMVRTKAAPSGKIQGFTDEQRKNYQLKSKRRK
ncbi:MAG: hypothetical protein AAB804_02935 [Patescibacteria group bacterium]